MTILFASLGVAFAGFCVWLGVRIVNRRERWAKWTLAAVIVGLPVLYVLSFGPACWWFTNPGSTYGKINAPLMSAAAINMDPSSQQPTVPHIYWPIGWLADRGPSQVFKLTRWYATWLKPYVFVPSNFAGDSWLLM